MQAVVILAIIAMVILNIMTNKIKKPLKNIKISSPFGWRIHPISKENKFHNGVDLSALTGTEIYAPKDGTVLKMYSNAIGGVQLLISHSNGLQTGYAHLSKYANIKVGDKVKQGDVIAYVGNTGASTGAHLHFTTKINNKYVNPVDLWS